MILNKAVHRTGLILVLYNKNSILYMIFLYYLFIKTQSYTICIHYIIYSKRLLFKKKNRAKDYFIFIICLILINITIIILYFH